MINAESYTFKYNNKQVFRKLNYFPMYVKDYERQDVSFDITEIKSDELILKQPVITWLGHRGRIGLIRNGL